MDIDTLRLFADVAARGSFTAVAKQRDLAPSSVSRAIGQLEDELGARLFQRGARQVVLTEAGVRLRERTVGLLDAFDATVEAVRGPTSSPRGTLRMTASVAFGERVIAPLVGAFRSHCPAVKLELLFTDRQVDLASEGIDLAVRLGEPAGADLVATRLSTTRYRAVASPGWCRSALGAETDRLAHPDELGECRCVLIDLAGHRREWHWRARRGDTGSGSVLVDGDVRCSSVLGVRRCALDGLGPALLADWLVDEDLAAGRLVELLPAHELSAAGFDTAAWLVYPSREWLPGKTRAMIDFLKERISLPG